MLIFSHFVTLISGWSAGMATLYFIIIPGAKADWKIWAWSVASFLLGAVAFFVEVAYK